MRTTFAEEISKSGVTDTALTQETAESDKKVTFPKHIKRRGKVLATIYRKSKTYPLYRVSWTVAGKRMMKAFATDSGKGGALEYAERLSRPLNGENALKPFRPRSRLGAEIISVVHVRNPNKFPFDILLPL
jgi:hypothetical protein